MVPDDNDGKTKKDTRVDELPTSEQPPAVPEGPKLTRSGRAVRPPTRYRDSDFVKTVTEIVTLLKLLLI